MPSRPDNLAATLLDGPAATARAACVALREGDRTITYADLRDRVARCAAALRDLGVAAGERVVVLMPDGIDAACALLGAVWAGAVAVPVSELGRGTDLRGVLVDAGAAVVVAHGSLIATVEAARGGLDALRHVIGVGDHGPGGHDFDALVAAAAPSAPVLVPADAPAFVLYSAGVRGDEDGVRRGVLHDHRGPLGAVARFAQVLPLAAGERVFSLGRLWTAYGLSTGLLYPLAVGAESMLLPVQAHTDAILAALAAARPDVMFATPSVYSQMARDALERGDRARPLTGVRACVSAAETTPTKVLAQSRVILGAELLVGYGLTEAMGFVLCGPGSARPGVCGRPVPGFELRLVDDAGAPVGPDEIGSLELRGEAIARSYWQGREPAVAADGWFHTRDRFMIDRDGVYHHCGREDQLFKVGGKWVAPSEIERVLLMHEAVWECAVIGADDEDGFTKPLAFVVPNIGHAAGPALTEELREWVKAELAPYKYPRWIEFVVDLPKGPHGKVLRYKLRERIRTTGRTRRAETASGS